MQQCPSGSTGYINASYIEYVDCDPASIASPNDPVDDLVPKLQCLDEQRKKSTSGRQYRRYISTQGPLPATYGDFWTVVWEQETRVIVMLTKEEEMNRVSISASSQVTSINMILRSNVIVIGHPISTSLHSMVQSE